MLKKPDVLSIKHLVKARKRLDNIDVNIGINPIVFLQPKEWEDIKSLFKTTDEQMSRYFIKIERGL